MEAWVSWAADVASIASLFVSLYVAWQVRGIRRRVVRRFVISSLVDQFEAHIQLLNKLIGRSSSQGVRVSAELAKCEANLKSALPHLEESALRDAREALAMMESETPDLRNIYLVITRLKQCLENTTAQQEASSYVE